MFHESDSEIEKWIKEILGDIEISFEPPNSKRTGRVIGAYLMEVARKPLGVGGPAAPDLKFELRYLITVSSDQPRESHRVLGQLMCHAIEIKRFEVEIEPLSHSFWNAIQTAPMPSFVIRIPVIYTVDRTAKPVVQSPPQVAFSETFKMAGVVFGPDRMPISDVGVSIPNLSKKTSSNLNGYFQLPGIPSQSIPPALHLSFKGRQFKYSLSNDVDFDEPIQIDLTKTSLLPPNDKD